MRDTTHEAVERELFIRAFFDTPPPPELAELLATRMKSRRYAPGETLYEREQPPGPMFFVTQGTVELIAPDEEPWVFEDRAMLGAIDANAGEPYTRTARAKTAVRAIEIHFDEYLEILEDFFDFAKAALIQSSQLTHRSALELAPNAVLNPPAEPSGRWIGLARLDEVQRLVVLRNSRPFGRAPVQSLVTLARSVSEERFSMGETIFRSGDRNRGMYLVADGLVRVEHDAPSIDALVGPGDLILGVIGIVPQPYAFSATAEMDVVVLRLDHEELDDAMEEHFALVRAWWAYIGRDSQRIRVELSRRNVASPPEQHIRPTGHTTQM